MPDEHDNDLLADLLDDEIAAGEAKPEAAVNMDEYNALKAQVEELETAKMGLLKAKQAQTTKRQGAEDRLNQMEGAVNALLSQRQQQGIESVTETQAADAKSKGIPVNYDDDGNGWIDPNYIAQLTSPYVQKINDLEARLQQSNATSNAQVEADRVMQGIIGEDERYGSASGKYRAARKWVEDQVFEFSKANGITASLNSGQALDHVFSNEYSQQEFKNLFGDLDLIDVVTAEDSQMNFRRTLGNIADAMTPKEDPTLPKAQMDSRFQKVLDKPSNLGGQANAKAGQLSVLDRLNNISPSELEEYTDDQIDTLLKLVSQE